MDLVEVHPRADADLRHGRRHAELLAGELQNIGRCRRAAGSIDEHARQGDVGCKLAAQGLQFGEAVARTHLVDRVDPFRLGGVPSSTVLATLSQQIDQQATLVASANLLTIVGCGCLLVAIFAAWQRWLR